MKTNEKRAEFCKNSDAPHTKMETQKQNNHSRNPPNFQTPKFTDAENISRREILEKSKLSRLPKLPERKPFIYNDAPKTVVVAVCAGCGANLDTDEPLQNTFTGCRKCIGIYGRIDAAFDENSKRKKKELLAKMAGGIK